MRRFRFLRGGVIAAFFVYGAVSAAFGQGAVLQSGPVTYGHGTVWIQNGILGDSGPASGGGVGVGLSELLLSVRGQGSAPYSSAGTGPFGTNFCDYDAPTTNTTGYHFLCMSPNIGGNGYIAYGSGGAATPGSLIFNINGATYTFPGPGTGTVVGPVSSVVGNLAIWANSSGTLLSSETMSAVLDLQFGTGVGSLICRGASGWQLLGSGTTGYLLQSAGAAGCPSWANPIAISGATITNVTATGTTNVSANSQIVAVKTNSAASVSIVLPASSNFPNCPASALACPVITVKDVAGDSSTGLITVTTADGKTIDGSANIILPYTLQSQDFVLLGTSWMVK